MGIIDIIGIGGCGFAFVACGGNALESSAPGGGAGNASAAGAFAAGGAVAQAGASAFAGGGGSLAMSAGAAGAGDSGAAGLGGSAAGAPGEPPADIAGRWAMFDFEDPVGVQLVQNGAQLTGDGCAGGVPPREDSIWDAFCGAVSGTVTGRKANFGFHFQAYDYLAEAVVSTDGTRMTGRFHGAGDWMPYPMAWLRAEDGQHWLPLPSYPPQFEDANYELQLTDADGDEYVPGKVYVMHYFRSSFGGDLGSFWYSEISQASPNGPLVVGPVALTQPELAVSMSVDVDNGHFTRFQATTGSGHHYAFSAAIETR